MAHIFRTACTATLALALAATPALARERADYNRSLGSVHEPIVSRTDYTLDVGVGPQGLAPGEPQRIAGWFDSLVLGYGDTVYVDDPAGGEASGLSADAVGMVLSRYGMLVSHDGAPVNAGHPAMGSVRIVVSRAVARVEGCPDYSRGNSGFEIDGANTSNFGCAAAVNLAAMIANPQDLVTGQQTGPSTDARTTVKAVAAWRDAKPTALNGLKNESTKNGGN